MTIVEMCIFAIIILILIFILFYLKGMKKDHVALFEAAADYKGLVEKYLIGLTEQQLTEQQMKRMAYQDSLTGLPNRYYVVEHFQAAQKNNLKTAVILYMNLDRFKVINDTLGLDIGDLLLQEVSNRLKKCIDPDDCLARLGGDEFIVCLPNKDQMDGERTAKQMLQSFNTIFQLHEYEMYISPSIGISLYPQDGDEIGTLIKKADIAMHQAKRIGRNNIQFYRGSSGKSTNDLFEMEQDLHRAIEREEFVLFYQPKILIRSGEITGFEALIRWQHPEKGLISPGQFIPLAEETGLIVQIGEWVLRRACEQLKVLQACGYPDIFMSVNLSVRQFFQPNLLGMVRQVLHETGISPKKLELEITESMMMDDHHALKIVNALKELNIRISLDDFGTGYSSLHYLKKYPIDIIKIDQSFIFDSLTDLNDQTIVKTIIAMGHQLKMEVLAEGVETKEQLLFLQENDCNKAQGFFISEPLPLEEIMEKYTIIEQRVKHFCEEII